LSEDFDQILHEANWAVERVRENLNGNEPAELTEALSLVSDAVSRLTETRSSHTSQEGLKDIQTSMGRVLAALNSFNSRLDSIEKSIKKPRIFGKPRRRKDVVPTKRLQGKK